MNRINTYYQQINQRSGVSFPPRIPLAFNLLYRKNQPFSFSRFLFFPFLYAFSISFSISSLSSAFIIHGIRNNKNKKKRSKQQKLPLSVHSPTVFICKQKHSWEYHDKNSIDRGPLFQNQHSYYCHCNITLHEITRTTYY